MHEVLWDKGFRINTLGGAPFIAKLMVKLLAQIKGSDKQKTTIRQTLEKDISRLKADINLLLDDAYGKLRKNLAIAMNKLKPTTSWDM